MFVYGVCLCMWAQVPQYTHRGEDNLCLLVLYCFVCTGVKLLSSGLMTRAFYPLSHLAS